MPHADLLSVRSECLHTMHGHTSTIRCLKVLDGRPVAVTGARDATIRVWDIERGVLLHNLTGHTHSVRCMEIAGHYCVSGSYDCTARVSCWGSLDRLTAPNIAIPDPFRYGISKPVNVFKF
jgi:WD40 repeat protein